MGDGWGCMGDDRGHMGDGMGDVGDSRSHMGDSGNRGMSQNRPLSKCGERSLLQNSWRVSNSGKSRSPMEKSRSSSSEESFPLAVRTAREARDKSCSNGLFQISPPEDSYIVSRLAEAEKLGQIFPCERFL